MDFSNDRLSEPVRLITIQEAVERASMSRSFIYERIKKGELRLVKIGSASRLVEKEFEEWLLGLIKVA